MADTKELIKLGIDCVRGSVENYSVAQANETMRKALIELNGGSTKLDYRKQRDGKYGELYTIIETVIQNTIYEDLLATDFFNELVEYRNVNDGDQEKFLIDDGTMFTIDKAADGSQAVRRQRIAGMTEVTVKTSLHVARIYEELKRVLAGRVDFNQMINKLAESFKRDMLNEVYAAFTGAVNSGHVFRDTSNTYVESKLLDVIDKVEAAAGGKTAILVGTKQALRGITVVGDNGKNMVDEDGYVGKFYGCPVIAVPQRFKTGTTTLMFDNGMINVIACDDKPIKFVTEGNPLIITRTPEQNMDLTMEYFCAENYGVGLAIAGGNAIGSYDYTA